jgi:hypothetical protein
MVLSGKYVRVSQRPLFEICFVASQVFPVKADLIPLTARK